MSEFVKSCGNGETFACVDEGFAYCCFITDTMIASIILQVTINEPLSRGTGEVVSIL